ncbi:MAG: L,D-transpeptidase family protein, partial [Gammaproteobacteria bacterium]|nr:L,D-transpeptidase family protein [Gammaproteobacteria bacterium]
MRLSSFTHVLAGLCAVAVITAAGGTRADSISTEEGYSLEIHKKERILRVLAGDEVTREFPIASGRGGSGDKFRRGDNRTPVGVYRIVDFNERSRFELFMRLNYPNVKDAFYGLKNGLISRPEFDAIVAALKQGATPPQNTPLGGAIGIHGIGDVTHEKLRIHDALDWTEGCIALT